jgi:hypothetical protein
LEIDARIIDLQSGQALSAASATAKDESQIRNVANQIGNKFAQDAHKITIVLSPPQEPSILE